MSYTRASVIFLLSLSIVLSIFTLPETSYCGINEELLDAARKFTPEEKEIFKTLKKIKVVINTDIPKDPGFIQVPWSREELVERIKQKLNYEGFTMVTKNNVKYDATIFVDYKEDILDYLISPDSKAIHGKAIRCTFRMVHNKVGEIFSIPIIAKDRAGENIATSGSNKLYDDPFFKELFIIKKLGLSPVDHFISALKDNDWEVRRYSAQHLGAMDDAIAVEPLIKALKDEYRLVRLSVIFALGELGDERAVIPLNNLYKKESNKTVKRAITEALNKIEMPEENKKIKKRNKKAEWN